MSARTAFESLAREAMERQDYWLAESLLREYLTAGPRCVPFLEMLGHVYEEKGDVMAAVAEYGKAVEVLLEDPDTDHPNRASELFGKIRSLAPGSPVAFRFAAMFDTVTGQMLQATPQPAVGDSGSEPPYPSPIAESPADSAAAVAMPWEQIESTPTDAAISAEAQAPTAGDSIETMASVAPLASVESVTEALRQDDTSDRTPAAQVPDLPTASELQLHHEPSTLSVASTTEPVQVSGQSEPRVADSALPAMPVAEDPQPTIEVLAQGSSHPIAEAPMSPAPMPWDQIEDAAPAISPVAASEVPTSSEVASTLSVEAELPAPPIAEVPESTIEVPPEPSLHPIAESMAGPASMPLEQIDDVAPASSPVTDSDGSTGAEVVSALSGEAELPPPPVLEAASPTIEVLRNASAHPIAEAPMSPAPMPWDQVEETPGAVFSQAEVKIEPEVAEAEKGQEVSVTDHVLDAGTAADPPIPPVPSFISSSGLSWEDILAAVTAMQAAPAPAQTMPRAESEAANDIAVPEETATTVTPPADPSETEWLSFAAPASDSFAGLVSDSPPLSAPMPWEQIEVEDVAIPRQDPEPEFGPVSADVVGGAQDSTVVMPVAEEMHDSVPTTGALADETVGDSLGHVESLSMPGFRILSQDAPVEPVEAPELAAVFEPEPPAESTIDLPIERPLWLAGSEAIAAPEPDEPRAVPAESLTEAVVGASLEMPPLTLEQDVVEDIQAPVSESAEAFPSNPPSLVEQPVAQVAGQEPTILTTPETVVEAAVPSVVPSVIADQPVVQAEPTALLSEIVRVEEEVAPVSEPERSPLLSQGHASMPDVAGCDAGAPQLRESAVPGEEISNEPALPVSEGIQAQSTGAPVAVRSDETNLASVESVQVAEVVVPAEVSEVLAEPTADVQAAAPAVAAAPEASVDGGLRILWDDSSSKPTPSASTGNMLTRWLKRPADVASVGASHPTTIPDEPVPPVAPPVGERPEATPLVTDRPVGRSDDSTPLHGEQPAPRSKPSKPAVGQAWHRIGRTVTSLIGAGVSTTRSLIVLVVALIGLTLAILAGSVGAIALTWLILEEQPTPAYRTMTSVPQHTLQDSQKNGYFLLLGFSAAPTQDPVQAGIDRRAEEADRAVTLTCLTGEGNGSGTQQGASAEVTGKWLKRVDPAAQMRIEAAGVKSWASQAGVAMGRYRQWLTKPFEDWGFGQPVSPNCGVILYAHRLYVAEGFAQDVDAGVARLETDLTAWRTVFGQAKTMPVKMLASDALNDDIAVVSGLLLRTDLDDRLISRLAKLARPLDQAEQSVRWPMQSQFVLATKTLEETVNHDTADARPFYGSVAAALPLPKQRRFNAYAQYYEAVGKAAAEGRYADLPKQSQFVRTPPYGLTDLLMNPIESLVGIDPLPTWETYAGRVLETDARLRLVSLQAWLRRAPPEQDLLTRVAKAGQGLYDPFTGFPMLVNMKKGVFYSVGRDLKDNEAQDRFDVVVQIPPTAWAGGKRTADLTDSK
ncbi:MAG: hypothetical protein HY348_00865 [Nitrospira defluvii]|nr:hypothetical protein [Nitrospira defluvii]